MPDKNIIAELSQISQVLTEIPACTPYKAPDLYFQTLSDLILYRITVIEPAIQDPQLQLNLHEKNPFRVPAGYFNHLAGAILEGIKAQGTAAGEEVKTLSPLLASISRKMPFNLPDNYFNELAPPAIHTGKSESAEDEPLSFLLQSLNKKETYRVPAGHFDQLAAAVLEKVQPAGARVIRINFTKKITRYAAAACVAGLVAVAGWFYVNRQPGLQAAGGDLANIKNISSQELQDFIDNNTVMMPDNTPAPNDIQAEDVKTMLAGVPDEELQQYLEQQPNLKDPSVNNYN